MYSLIKGLNIWILYFDKYSSKSLNILTDENDIITKRSQIANQDSVSKNNELTGISNNISNSASNLSELGTDNEEIPRLFNGLSYTNAVLEKQNETV